jgi:L-ascorbate metabolism protein UlaG (beta-lactamase superfamily)
MKWIGIGKKLKGWKNKQNKGYTLHRKFYLDESSHIYKQITKNIKNKKNFIANLGHSTFFIYFEGIKILTDPFLSPHIFGIKRQEPAILPYLLPQMDYILISHAHYDHLDLRTLRRLNRNAKIILPENTKKVLGNMYFLEKIEIPHWLSYEDKKVKVLSLPVKHNKGRSLIFPNTEVSSYLIDIKGTTFYFGGDSAYFEGYKKYGEKFKIDFALLPIGGYEPRLILKNVHMNPQEAVQAFLDLKAKYIIPIHFGTYHTFPKFVKVEAPLNRFLAETKIKDIKNKTKVILPNKAINL